MAQFQYIARTSAGAKVTGMLEAATEAAAVRALDEKSLYPVRVTEQAEKKSEKRGQAIRVREQSAIYEQLSDLLRAGVPLLRALDTLSRTNANQRVVAVVKQIHDDVASGKALEEAMSNQPAVFSTLQTAMVRAGERGGFLEAVLADLGVYLERQDELRGKVRGAMIYPILLIMIGVAVVTGCLLWMVPKFKPIFKGISLPLPSQILFTASDLVAVYWPMTLMGSVLGLITLVLFFKTPTGKKTFQWLQLHTPLVGHAIRMVSITRFCRVLGTMLAAGVPLLQALAISRDAAGLPSLAASIDTAIESVRGGQGLTSPLRQSNLFPPQLLEMIAVAEESNQLEKVLLKISDTIEKRTNQQVDAAVRLLEPVILVLLAGVILFVALGLLYPIFTMARTIR